MKNDNDSMFQDGDVTASDFVEHNLREYSQFTIASKFPHYVDGLKTIHRRILWLVKNDEDRSTKANKKVATITGRVMEYHPHGDASISETITSMMQPFSFICPFMEGIGYIGSYGTGGQGAAPRYLEGKLAEFSKDVFFKKTHQNAIRFKPSITGDGIEPVYFIPVIPTALLTGCFGLSIGFQMRAPSLNFESLCILTKEFIKLRKNYLDHQRKWRDFPESPIFGKHLVKYVMPDFPTECLVRNRKQLTEAYSRCNDNHVLVLDGTLTIAKGSIIIHTLPPGQNFQAIYTNKKINAADNRKQKTLYDLLATKGSFMQKNVSGLDQLDDKNTGKMKGHIELTMKRGANPFDILDELKGAIRFSQTWHPRLSFVTSDEKMINLNYFSLLDEWYKERHRAKLAELKYTQTELVKKFRENEAKIIVCDHGREIFKVFESHDTWQDTVPYLSKKYGLTKYQVEFLSQVSLKQITKKGKQGLLEEAERIKQRMDETQKKFGRINEIMIEEIEYIQKKYGAQYQRKAKLPDFIGCVQVPPNGIVQFMDLDELISTMSRFEHDSITINEYPKGVTHKYQILPFKVEDDEELDHPKQMCCDDFVVSKYKLKNTIGLLNNGTIFRTQGLLHKPLKGVKFFYVSDKFISFTEDGHVNLVDVTTIPLRKTVDSRGVFTDITYVSNMIENELVVAHMNSREKNVVRVDRVSTANGRLSKLAAGKTQILWVGRLNDNATFTVPKKLRGRMAMTHVRMTNLEKLFDGKSLFMVQLGKKLIGKKKFKRISRSHIWQI